jgi:hypothetical protein
VLLAFELEPLRVRQGGAGLHAQQRVVGLVVLTVRVVRVVGGEQRRADPAGDLDQLRVGLVLGGEPVVLQFDEQVVLAEDLLQPAGLLEWRPARRRCSSACSTWPPRQPVVAISPSCVYFSSSSQSIRGL